MRIDRKLLSPEKILTFIWISAVSLAYIATLPTVRSEVGTNQPVFTPIGIVWIIFCLLSFIIGARIAKSYEFSIQLGDDDNDTISRYDYSNIRNGIIISYIFVAVVYIYLSFWAILTVQEMNGINTFMTSLYSNWHHVWRTWVANKPFAGARVLYTGLIAVGIFAVTQISYYQSEDRGGNLINFKLLLILALIPLFILPLIVSRRVLLATVIFGGIVSYISASDKGVKLSYVYVPIIVAFGLWTLQEILVRSVSDGFLLHGIHRVLYYFSNDVGNVSRAVSYITARSYGLNSFQFLTEYLFITDRLYDSYLGELQRQSGEYRFAGTWTLLGNPYIDFGWLGLLVLTALGFVSRTVYQWSQNSKLGIQLYALIAAGLILSWHYSLFSRPEFIFNIGLLIVINKSSFFTEIFSRSSTSLQNYE